MQGYYGYQEIDGKSLMLEPGKVYEAPFTSIAALTRTKALSLLAAGYTTVRLVELPAPGTNPAELPLNITSLSAEVNHKIEREGNANFVLKKQNGEVRYAIVNGFVYDLEDNLPSHFQGLII